MRPRTLSASSLHVARLCMARYKAENIDRAARGENSSASLGTTVHAALEMFIKLVYLQNKPDQDSFETLEMFFRIAYQDVFGEMPNAKEKTYKDGLAMLKNWYDRHHQTVGNVISCEVKSHFMVKTSIGEIQLNYIWDRFDQTGEDEYTVVDYKSNVWNVTPDELNSKVQPKVYALAAQIEHPEAKRIWVKFDMLRFDMVGVVFSKEENRQTYKWIQAMAEKIIAAPDNPPETLNEECRFCVRRNNCGAIATNLTAGGIATVINEPSDVLLDLRTQLDFQIKAAKINLQDIDNELLTRARDNDLTVLHGNTSTGKVSIYARRNVDADRVRLVTGNDIFLDYGGLDLTLGQFDELLKDNRLTDKQKRELQGLIYKTTGEPSIKSKTKV